MQKHKAAAVLIYAHTQAQLFDVCGMADLVEAAVDGYNATGVRVCLMCVPDVDTQSQAIQL